MGQPPPKTSSPRQRRKTPSPLQTSPAIIRRTNIMTHSPPAALSSFLTRWRSGGGAAPNAPTINSSSLNSATFSNSLIPTPPPPMTQRTTTSSTAPIHVTNPDGTTTPNFIDLYKRAHFVLETKQGLEQQNVAQPPSAVSLARHIRPGEAGPNPKNAPHCAPHARTVTRDPAKTHAGHTNVPQHGLAAGNKYN
jgi:hypothetical protein